MSTLIKQYADFISQLGAPYKRDYVAERNGIISFAHDVEFDLKKMWQFYILHIAKCNGINTPDRYREYQNTVTQLANKNYGDILRILSYACHAIVTEKPQAIAYDDDIAAARDILHIMRIVSEIRPKGNGFVLMALPGSYLTILDEKAAAIKQLPQPIFEEVLENF
jgi:hypothetical protein